MSRDIECDLLVVGSGAAGLATAITAKKRGLNVVVIEKEPVFGGTTALSGGVLWIPLGPHGRKQNPADTREAVRSYMMQETGAFYDEAAVAAFLDNGPKMVEFFDALRGAGEHSPRDARAPGRVRPDPRHAPTRNARPAPRPPHRRPRDPDRVVGIYTTPTATVGPPTA